MKASKTITTLLALVVMPLVYANESASHMASVEGLIAAFNAHDSDAMAEFLTDDVVWLSVANGNVAVEANGKSDLIASMDAYFESCPTCRSEISESISTPARTSAIEIASWEGKSGPQSQRSLSIYEFSGDLIHRVYYFPAEK
jgi:hypothetical protein